MGTSLKGKILLPEGANSFPEGMENHFYHSSLAPLSVPFLLHKSVYCVMGATPKVIQTVRYYQSKRGQRSGIDTIKHHA